MGVMQDVVAHAAEDCATYGAESSRSHDDQGALLAPRQLAQSFTRLVAEDGHHTAFQLYAHQKNNPLAILQKYIH